MWSSYEPRRNFGLVTYSVSRRKVSRARLPSARRPMMWKNVVLPEGFFDGVDVVALATTVNQPCQHCGQRHDGVGLIAHGGGLFCQRCGFRTEARAAKTKHQRRAPAKRPIVRVMATSMPRPRPREGGARGGGRRPRWHLRRRRRRPTTTVCTGLRRREAGMITRTATEVLRDFGLPPPPSSPS